MITTPVDFSKGPFRLCCGKQHWGAVCPDGRVMCCLCFGLFTQSDLSIDKETGKIQNVCKVCYNQEQQLNDTH